MFPNMLSVADLTKQSYVNELFYSECHPEAWKAFLIHEGHNTESSTTEFLHRLKMFYKCYVPDAERQPVYDEVAMACYGGATFSEDEVLAGSIPEAKIVDGHLFVWY